MLTKRKICQKKSNSLYSPMTNIFILKIDWNRTETVGEVGFWNFSSHRSYVNEKKNLKN